MTPTPEQPPRIAVIIVSRNAAEDLQRSLTALHGRGLFLIVVDSGWGDSASMDVQFPGVRFIRLPRDFGMTKAMNLGIRAAETEYVAFVAPAVTITAETLEALAATLDTEPLTGAVAPLLPIDQVSELPAKQAVEPQLRAGKAGERVPCVVIGAVMFRSFFLRALRHIDERYGDYGADIELCQQVKRAGKTILIHSTATAGSRPVTVAGDADHELGLWRFLGKHYGFVTGILYLIGRIFAALFRFNLKKAWLLITQTKNDGNG